MDMTMSMDMPEPTAAFTSSAAAASSTAGTNMNMDMGMGGCKISMLWNWHTVDACFISSQWRVTSAGYFAGTCIGVIALTMCLPALRRLHQLYDSHTLNELRITGAKGRRPPIYQQIVRAFLHTLQFAVAYFVMLMAMYYNGYIIISILIGAFLGYFLFEYRTLDIVSNSKEDATEVTGCCG